MEHALTIPNSRQRRREKMLKNEVQSQYVDENKESRFGSKPNFGSKP